MLRVRPVHSAASSNVRGALLATRRTAPTIFPPRALTLTLVEMYVPKLTWTKFTLCLQTRDWHVSVCGKC